MKKVLVAMSGGVDSSVAAYLLQKEGYEVIGVTMKYWTDPQVSEGSKKVCGKCCVREEAIKAAEVCASLGIEHFTKDYRDSFKKEVVDYFLRESEKGLTPNPCVVCNPKIKFKHMIDLADQLSADFVATGHYARLSDDKTKLLKAKDPIKDQSYFIHKLSPEALKRIIFPVGNLIKDEVRKIAQRAKLPIDPNKQESQDVCFYLEKTPEQFLKRHIKKLSQPGDIKTLDGKILGQHKGLALYTIGQRKGIDVGGLEKPFFVVKKEISTNTLYVDDEKNLFQTEFRIKDPIFRQDPYGKKLTVKVRARHKDVPCTLNKDLTVTLKEPVCAVTPGQFAVFYDGDVVLGGGEII